MMYKYITILALLFSGFQTLNAQVTLDIGDVSSNCNNNINVPVTVSNFNTIVGVQFTIEWDETQLQFVNINNLNATLGLLGTNFNTNNAASGLITFAWFSASNPNGFNLNNGTPLFDILFTPLSSAGTNTPIIFTSSLTGQEVSIPPFTPVPANWINGSVTVGDSTPPMLSCPGAVNIQAPQGATSVVVTGLTPNASDNCGVPSVTYNITGATTGNGSNSANGTSFNIGNSVVNYTATDQLGNTATCSVNVSITQSFMEDTLIITAGSATVGCGQQLVLPVMVTSGFTNILSFQFGMTWDPSILQFTGVSGLAGLPDFDNTAFITNMANNGLFGVVWNDDNNSGESLNNGTILFNMVFNVIPGTEDGSSMTIGNFNITMNATAPGAPPTAVPVQGIGGVVILEDNVSPSITCPANVNADAGGASSIVVNNINAQGTDACGSVLLNYNITGATGGSGTNASGTSFNVGVSTVTYTATDINSNTNTCSFTVSVTSTNPVVTLIAESEVIQCNGEFGITVSVNGFTQLTSLQFSMNWNGNVIDYNTIGALANLQGLNLNSLGTANAENGSITFSWFDPDLSGETLAPGTALFTIFFLGDGGFGQNTNISFTSAPAAIEAAGTGFPPIEVDVNTVNGSVQITDTSPPVVDCPNDLTIAAGNGNNSIVLNGLAPDVNDNCIVTNVSYNTSGATLLNGFNDISGQPFNVGLTTVVYSATDVAGLTASCNFQVLVLNSGELTLSVTPQSGSCGNNLTVPVTVDFFNEINSLQFTLEWNENMFAYAGVSGLTTLQGFGMSNIGIAQVNNGLLTFSWSDPDLTGEDLPLGTVLFNLNLTAIGNSSDVSNISFVNVPTAIEAVAAGFPPQALTVNINNSTLSIIDNTNPEITCPQDITVQAGIGQNAVVVNNIAPAATDNCNVASITYTLAGANFANGVNDASGTAFNLGTTLVTYIVSDDANNINTCSFLVTVNAPQVLTLIADSGTEECGNEFDFDVSVNNFNDIANIQFSIQWDPSVLSFENTLNYNNDLGVLASNFGVTQVGNGILTFSWFGIPGVTLPNGTNLFSIHFTPVSSNNTQVTFTNIPVVIEASQEGFPPVEVAVQTNNGFINVIDTQAPDVITCPSDVTVNTSNGTCTASASWANPVFEDNCDDNLTISASHTSGSLFNGGNQLVTYTATDDDGNAAICSFNVVVLDNQSPIWAGCPPAVNAVLPPDTCSAIVVWTTPTATDNCDLTLDITTSHASGAQFNTGMTTVTYVAADDAGNTAVCSFVVTLSDTIAPVMLCPDNIIVYVSADSCIIPVNWNTPVATDNCAIPVVTSNVSSGTLFVPGEYVVVYTATDASANITTCTFNISVRDTLGPILVSCPDDVTFPVTGSLCTGITSWVAPEFTDNCDIQLDIVSNQDSGDVLPIGIFPVVYTATDNFGNTAICSFVVTIADQNAPEVTSCPSDIIINNGPDSCGATVFFDSAIFTDSCDNDLVLQVSHLSGSVFPIGNTIVGFTATDDSGNTGQCFFFVTVNDVQVPVIDQCPVDITVDSDPGLCSAVVSWAAPTATDNCPGLILNTADSNGGTYPVGVSTVQYTATDAANNSVSCTFNITVTGNTSVTVTGCPDDITVTENLPGCTSVATWVDPVITGDCSDPNFSVTQSHFSGNVFLLGTTTVTYEVTTQSGTSTVCEFDVTVEDDLAPVIIFCPSNLIINTPTCSGAAIWDLPIVQDNCSSVSTVSNVQIGDMLPIGTTNVVYSFVDASGNLSVCGFEVEVIETTPPVFDNCPNEITLSVDANCQGTGNWDNITVSDNCGSVTLGSSHVPGDIFNSGSTAVTYTATDIAGNEAICVFNVIVIDDEAPVFDFCPDDQTINANLPDCQALAAWLEPTFSDNCGLGNITLVQSHFSGTAFSLGTTEVEYIIADAMNQAICSFNITVADNQPPIITVCPDDITIQAVECEATALFDLPQAVDNCGSVDVQFNILPGDILPTGINPVNYTFSDLAGNSVTCEFNIMVMENDPPFFFSCPASFAVEGDANCQATAFWDLPIALDLCSIPVLTSTHDPGDQFTAGSTVVVYTATDAAGNSDLCSFLVTVTGGELGITCPDNVLALADADVCFAPAIWPDPILTGNCDLTGSFISDFNSGELFPVGTTVVSYLATNTSGSTANCTFSVLVLDVSPPNITICPDDVTVTTSSNDCSAVASYNQPEAQDNCSIDLTFDANILPGDILPVGCHEITVSVTDEAGNFDECTFQICVADQTLPEISCPEPVIVQTDGTIISDPNEVLIALAPVDCEHIQLDFIEPLGTDNCSDAVTLQTDNSGLASGSDFMTNNYLLEYTVTDASGNTASCNFNITVLPTPETVVPVATPNPVCGIADVTITASGLTGDYTWTLPDLTTSSDQNLVIQDFDASNVGSYSVVIVLGNGCIVSGSVTVTQGTPVEIEATTNGLSCVPADLLLNGTGISGNPVNWTWTGPNQFTSNDQNAVIPSADITAAGVYTLTGCNDDGCCSQFELTIAPAIDLGTPLIQATDLEICVGESVTLTATDYPGAVYSWTATSPSTAGLPADTQTNPITVTPLSPGIFTYFVVAEAGACISDQGLILITVNDSPTPVLSSNDPLDCTDGTASLELFETSGTANTWMWTGPNTSDVQNPVFDNATTADAGWYAVVITDDNGCIGEDSILVEITEIPAAPEPFGADVYCLGGVLELFVDGLPQGTIYSWSGPNGFTSDEAFPIVTENIQPFHAGNYTLVVTIDGCQSPVSAPVIVNVLSAPEAVTDNYDILESEIPELDILTNDTVAGSVNITITNAPFNGTASVNDNVGTITYDPNEGFNGGETFSYEICYEVCPDVCAEAIVMINVTGFCLIPNIITPNGDGLNDELLIPCLQGGKFPENELIIYNEWGDEVFSALPYNNDWQGTYEDKPLPDGTYFYNFRESPDSDWIKGFVTIYR